MHDCVTNEALGSPGASSFCLPAHLQRRAAEDGEAFAAAYAARGGIVVRPRSDDTFTIARELLGCGSADTSARSGDGNDLV